MDENDDIAIKFLNSNRVCVARFLNQEDSIN